MAVLYERMLLSCVLLITTRTSHFGSAAPDQNVVPVFEVEPQSTVVPPGGVLELVCLLDPKTSDIRWTRDGQSVADGGGVVTKGGLLRITNMSQALTGNYECVASTSYGSVVSSAARVQIASLENFASGTSTMFVNVTEGNTALIPCMPPNSIPTAIIVFELNGAVIDMATGRHMVLPSGNLHIDKVKASDQGAYRCIAMNNVLGTKVWSPSIVQLRVTAAIIPVSSRLLAKSPEKMTVLRGETLILECLSQGSPVPVITWDKHGSFIPDKRAEFRLGNLLLRNVDQQDAGSYVCRSSNGINQPSIAVTDVEVLEKPTVVMEARYHVVSEGGSVALKCNVVRGKPKVHVHWLHNGAKLISESVPGVTINDNILNISNIRSGQTGLYQCVGKNRVGASHATGYVDVTAAVGETQRIERPDRKNAVGLLSLTPSNTSVTEGDQLTLLCEADGALGDTVTVRWLLDGFPLAEVVTDNEMFGLCATDMVVHEHFSMSRRGSLCISNTRRRDSGQYICLAYTDFVVDYAIAHVTVSARRTMMPLSTTTETPVTPKRKSTAPPLIHQENNKKNNKKKQGKSQGNKKSTGNERKQQAAKDLLPTGHEEFIHVDDDRLTESSFTGPQPSKSNNRLPYKSEKRESYYAPADLQKRTKDVSESGGLKPPSQPEVTPLTDTSVLIKWKVSGKSSYPIELFRIQYREIKQRGASGSWQTAEGDIQAKAREYTLEGLQAGASYRFRVMAIYKNSDNRASENSVKVTMGPSSYGIMRPPQGEPIVVSLESLHPGSLTVYWQYVINGPTMIDGFNIQYKLNSDKKGDYRTETATGAETRTYDLYDLQPGEEYTVRVLATNEAGMSKPSNNAVRRTRTQSLNGGDGSLDGGDSLAHQSLSPMLHPENEEEETIIEEEDYNANRRRSLSAGSDTLYKVLGVVLGSLVLILVICSVFCFLRQRQLVKRQANRESHQKFEDPSRTIHRNNFQNQQQSFLLNGVATSAGPVNGAYPTGQQRWSNGHAMNGAEPTTDDDDVFIGGPVPNGGIHLNINPLDNVPAVTYRPPSRQSDRVSMRDGGIAARPVSRGSMMSFGDTKSLDRSNLSYQRSRTRSQASQDGLEPDARRTPFPTIPETQPLNYGDSSSFYPNTDQSLYENGQMMKPLPSYNSLYANKSELPGYNTAVMYPGDRTSQSRLVYPANGEVPTFPRMAAHRSLKVTAVDPPTLPRQMSASYSHASMPKTDPFFKRSMSQSPANNNASLPTAEAFRRNSSQSPPAPYTVARQMAGTPVQFTNESVGRSSTPTGRIATSSVRGASIMSPSSLPINSRTGAMSPVSGMSGNRPGAMSPMGISAISARATGAMSPTQNMANMPGYMGSLTRHGGQMGSLSRGIHMGATPVQQQLNAKVVKSPSGDLNSRGQGDYIPRIHEMPYYVKSQDHAHDDHQLAPCQCNGSPETMRDMATSTDLSGSDTSFSQAPDDELLEPSPLAQYLKTSPYFTPQSQSLIFATSNQNAAHYQSSLANQNLLLNSRGIDNQNRYAGVPSAIENVL